MSRTPKPHRRIPTPTTPDDDAPDAAGRQINVRLDALTLQRLATCGRDATFHGGAPATLALVVRKAVGTYLSAYEAERTPVGRPPGQAPGA